MMEYQMVTVWDCFIKSEIADMPSLLRWQSTEQNLIFGLHRFGIMRRESQSRNLTKNSFEIRDIK